VLEEACDPTNPPLERLKFACIVASNLDEFFMVRVAALKNAFAEGDTAPDVAGLTPAQQLQKISERGHAMVEQLYAALTGEILPPLAERGLRLVRPGDLEAPARAALTRYFKNEVLPALTPLAIDASRPFPMLASLSLNLAVLIGPAEGRGRAAPGGGAGAGPAAAPGASAGRRGHGARAARGRDLGRPAGACFRARRSATSPPSASRATPSSTSTTRAAATSCR
jgi:hypothetical protein